MKKKKYVFLVIVFIVIIVGSFILQKQIIKSIAVNKYTIEKNTITEYLDFTNPIDEFYMSKIYNASCEVEFRDLQDAYYTVWAKEFDILLRTMKSKCKYEEDINAITAYEESVNRMIENVESLLITEWQDNYELPPNSPERGSWGNGTRSGLNMEKGKILRDASMLLIPYCDTYTFPKVLDLPTISDTTE